MEKQPKERPVSKRQPTPKPASPRGGRRPKSSSTPSRKVPMENPPQENPASPVSSASPGKGAAVAPDKEPPVAKEVAKESALAVMPAAPASLDKDDLRPMDFLQPTMRNSSEMPAGKMPATDIPGMDAVGHGIYLRPYHPYELKRVLFKREHYRPLAFQDATQAYYLPEGYEVDDSPPMPANQFLNQVLIEESYDRFSKQTSLDTNLSVGIGAFSLNASASQTGQMRSSEDSYYALRSSFIPLWSVYLSDFGNVIKDINEFPVPTPFKHEHRAKYDRFFEHFGSHYVKRVWIGGKAVLFLTIAKSTGMTKEEIQAGLKASYGAIGKGDVSARMDASREKLSSSSECSVAGKGGDEVLLAALSTLDEGKYNAWLKTIRDNPQTIEMEAAGIWTLVDDPNKASALQDAYEESTVFTAISAAFAIDKQVYFVRSRKYFCFHIERQDSEKPKLLTDKWPALASIGFDRIDAAFNGRDLVTSNGERLNRKLFFFRKDQVARIDIDEGTLDPGFPQPISTAFPGVEFERVDASMEIGRETVFLFSGNKYVRFNMKNNKVDPGYPDYVQKRWVGVTFERLDAALYWGNSKVYFFKDDQHIRYDLTTRCADPGYPKHIVGNYVEDWRFFD